MFLSQINMCNLCNKEAATHTLNHNDRMSPVCENCGLNFLQSIVTNTPPSCEQNCEYCEKVSTEVIYDENEPIKVCLQHAVEFSESTPNLAQRNGFDAECLYY